MGKGNGGFLHAIYDCQDSVFRSTAEERRTPMDFGTLRLTGPDD